MQTIKLKSNLCTEFSVTNYIPVTLYAEQTMRLKTIETLRKLSKCILLRLLFDCCFIVRFDCYIAL